MSKVLVTGLKGFIGQKVDSHLRALGHEPISFDIVDGQNILRANQLRDAVESCDVVIHMAAIANLYRSKIYPDETYNVNVLGTKNVASMCKKFNKKMIYISTCCVYGVQDHDMYHGHDLSKEYQEDTYLPNPAEFYAFSKYAGESIVRAYGAMYGMRWNILRIATVWGHGMRKELGMHIFFTQALLGKPITVHGEGHQTRTLTNVEDIAEGIARSVNAPDNQIYNISTETQVSANEMAEMIKEVTGSASEIVHIKQRSGQVFEEQILNKKARDMFGFSPKTEINLGSLTDLLPWMKEEVVRGNVYEHKQK